MYTKLAAPGGGLSYIISTSERVKLLCLLNYLSMSLIRSDYLIAITSNYFIQIVCAEPIRILIPGDKAFILSDKNVL